ncbi:hypothetical protein ACJRO7_033779 [Eucalyptus globulus]|uniref:Uncharacterized protein n=1 Tax=Eucalyptus globulus TaxID=34317 RepID=A0ABD3J570_EUCGL
MNDLDGLFAPDFGLKSQVKSAPMSAPKPSPNSRSFPADPDPVSSSRGAQRSENLENYGGFDRTKGPRKPDFGSAPVSGSKSSSSLPRYDKPVYDEGDDDGDVLDRVLGSKGSSSASGGDHFDDLLAGVGKKDDGPRSRAAKNGDKGMQHFDALLPGFGRKSSPIGRPNPESSWSSRPRTHTSKMTEDPFVVLGSTSPHVASSSNKTGNAGSTAADGSSASAGEIHNGSEMLSSIRKSAPSFSFNKNDQSRREMNVENGSKFQHTSFDMASGLNRSHKSTGQTASSPIYGKGSIHDTKTQGDSSPWSEQNVGSSDEVWLTVSEIPLFTQPTTVPPPSRPPPPLPTRIPKAVSRLFGSKSAKKKINDSSSFANPTQRYHSPKSIPLMTKVSSPSAVDELEKFARGSSPINPDDLANGLSREEHARNTNAAASSAAMKAAMDRAEAKFRHAKEVRGRGSTKAARSKDTQLEEDENVYDSQEQAFKEKQREEEEREQRRLEKERERAREIERERARQAVGRATREVRERAAAEARLRAERAALEKANAEVRERAERAAVQRAQAEARERAANEAKERAEKAAAEAREREAREKAAEARIRAERAAVERATADVRQRATTEARQKAAAAAAGASRASQASNDNDLDSFFEMGSHATTAPRPRVNSSDPEFDTKTQKRQRPEAAKPSAATSSNIRKPSSTANLADDLSSLFGGAAPSREFQEVEGETEERRRARLERHQRTQERTAKALAEKNQRDLQTLKEQEERHRIAETLDVEIKRWATGKEGNLRALLSTLQYVLWPECGWEPVSLTDLIAAASVKKFYRKATLCIHPDKVQQKGANLQQKYIAEKVFDFLKEAWNKFNSEELF